MTASKKLTTPAAESAEPKVEILFSKKQILAAKKFKNRKDLLQAILSDNKQYTMETVEQLMNDFLEGQVK